MKYAGSYLANVGPQIKIWTTVRVAKAISALLWLLLEYLISNPKLRHRWDLVIQATTDLKIAIMILEMDLDQSKGPGCHRGS
jgi:hypothetical protein